MEVAQVSQKTTEKTWKYLKQTLGYDARMSAMGRKLPLLTGKSRPLAAFR
jgi:hypothetical protein